MTDWRAVIENSGVLPDGLSPEDGVAELSEMLRSPDPVTRDDLGYYASLLVIPRLGPELRRSFGDTLAGRFQDPEVQARTFAPLTLNALVKAGAFDVSWVAAFEAWYATETDLRGWDAELGWVHALAHGADLLGTFGQHPEVAPTRMLTLAATRLLAETDYVMCQQEDDRLGCAIALTLTREELTEAESVAWLDPIAASLEADFADETGPVRPYASNTMRTLRVVYMMADRGVRPDWGKGETRRMRHGAAVRDRVAAVLAIASPFTG